MIDAGSLELMQARVQARHGQRLGDVGWQALQNTRDFGALLAAVVTAFLLRRDDVREDVVVALVFSVALAVGVSQLEADIPLFDGLGMLVSWHTIIRVRARESEIEREHQ